MDRTGFQNWDRAACSVVAVLTVLLWCGTGGDGETTGKEERRKKGGERRRYKGGIWSYSIMGSCKELISLG